MKAKIRKFDPSGERMEVRLNGTVKLAAVERAQMLGVSVAHLIETMLERELGVQRWPKISHNRLEDGSLVVTRTEQDGTIARFFKGRTVIITPEGERSVIESEGRNNPWEQAVHWKPSQPAHHESIVCDEPQHEDHEEVREYPA